jgi:hypothetical protein
MRFVEVRRSRHASNGRTVLDATLLDKYFMALDREVSPRISAKVPSN